MTKLSEIKRAAEALTRKQLLQLDTWLHELLAAAEAKKLNGGKARRPVREEELPLRGGQATRPLLVRILD
jgi:hypothetical protein